MKTRNKLITILILSFIIPISFTLVFNEVNKALEEANVGMREFDKNLISTLKKKTEHIETPSKHEDQSEDVPILIKHKLDVPHIVQENSYFCVPATLQMVLKYKGHNISQTTLAKDMNTNLENGTEYDYLARVANKYLFNNEKIGTSDAGYRVQTLSIGSMSREEKLILEDRIKTNISTKDPTFVAIDNQTMYENVSKANHMIIVIGYNINNATNEIESYIFIDPSYVVNDPIHGGLKVVSKENLYKAIYENEEPAYIY